MTEWGISKASVTDLIETGSLKRKDERHLWIYKHYSERRDNLLCVAAVEDEVLVIKTLMNHWREATP